MTGIHNKLPEQLVKTGEAMGKYYDRKRQSIEEFKMGGWVILSGKNIRSKGTCQKLENEMFRPFEIILVGHNNWYWKLCLPSLWKIDSRFDISLLEPYRGKNREREVVQIEADNAGWTIEMIITSGPSNNDPEKHVFLVQWEGYSREENTWKILRT